MEISFIDIVAFIEGKEYNFKIIGKGKERYKIASLFFPEPEGFYFVSGEELKTQLCDSLILTNSVEIVSFGADNTFIFIDGDPQVVYYELLDHYYKTVSTGEVSPNAIIDKEAKIGNNVQIDPFVVIKRCIIGDNCIISSHTVLNDDTIIGNNSIIGSNCSIGATGVAWVINDKNERINQPQLGGVVIEENCQIGANTVVVRGSLNESTRIGKNTVIAPGAKIGHGCQVGENVHFSNNVVLAGNVKISEGCFLGSGSIIISGITIPENTIVGAGAMVNRNFEPGSEMLVGIPAKILEKNKSIKLLGIPLSNQKHG